MRTHSADISAAAATGVPPKARLAMIDIGKGIGILLIVIGHNGIFDTSFPWLGDFIMTFRLPFFFFISGTTFSMGARSIGTVAYERADAWLKPCAVVVIAIGLIRVLLHVGSFENIALGLVYGTGFTLMWTPTWFLPHLWLLYMFSALLLGRGKRLVDSWPKRLALLSIMATTGYFFLQLFDSSAENPACVRILEFGPDLLRCGLPFSADILFLTAMFFLMGNFLSARVKQFALNWPLMIGALAVMLALDYVFGFKLDFNQRRYDDVIVSTAQAFCGIYVMLCLCKLLSVSAWATKVFSYLGRASLFILIFHATVMYKLTDLLMRVTDVKWLIALIGIGAAIGVSIALWEICKRNKFAAMLLLPVKRAKPVGAIAALPA